MIQQSLFGYLPEKFENTYLQRYMHPYVTVALFMVAKTRKQPKCPSIDNWIKKMWYICTMEYYSAIRKDEILPFATTRINFEIIMLSEVSWREEPYFIHSYVGYKTESNKLTNKKKKQKLIDNSMVITRGKGEVGVVKGKGDHIYGDKRSCDFG